jgi:predicted phage tail protein
MPSRLTEERAKAIAESYHNHSFDKTNALKAIKNEDGSQYYSNSYCETLGHKLYNNIRVKKYLDQIEAENKEILDYNREKAISMLKGNYDLLKVKAKASDIQAINARVAIIKEFNAISGLHVQTIKDGKEEVERLTKAEEAEAQRLANIRLKVG